MGAGPDLQASAPRRSASFTFTAASGSDDAHFATSVFDYGLRTPRVAEDSACLTKLRCVFQLQPIADTVLYMRNLEDGARPRASC
eukprot:2518972-Prymnesium_polylepis.1